MRDISFTPRARIQMRASHGSTPMLRSDRQGYLSRAQRSSSHSVMVCLKRMCGGYRNERDLRMLSAARQYTRDFNFSMDVFDSE